MRIVDNVRGKLRAYSFGALALSLPVFLVPEIYYAFTGWELASPYTVGFVALFLYVFGLLGWFLDQKQPSLWRSVKLVGISLALSAAVLALLSLPARAFDLPQEGLTPPVVQIGGLPSWDETSIHAVPLVAQWEGMETTAYLDRIANPPVWTVCFGETFNVAPREVRTEAECWDGLNAGLQRYWAGWRRGLTIDTLHPKVDAAFTSLSWNIGIGATLGSSALAALNSGDVLDACRRLTFWNRAGNRVVRGLVNRRAAENKVCLEGAML